MKYLIIGFALVFIGGCTKPISPIYAGVTNFRIKSIGFSKTTAGANIKLYNPNRYNLEIKQADADVYLNKKYFGHALLDTAVVLRKMDTTLVPLSISAKSKDILLISADILRNNNVSIKLTGTVKAGRGGIYINVPVNYEGSQTINLNCGNTSPR
jgi:LEA14-like dessication related protein